MKFLTEDEVRDIAAKILKLETNESVIAGVGQLTSFNQLGFKGVKDRPDGWYLPKDTGLPAIILEVKGSNIPLKTLQIDELKKNCMIAMTKYKNVIGILYNSEDIKIFKNNEELKCSEDLQNKDYYLSLVKNNKIDKNLIYSLTKKINDCLQVDFGIKNLYHRMIFTACALVAKRYGATLIKGMNYTIFHTSIATTLSASLVDSKKINQKLELLLDVFKEIRMNSTENQQAIDNFIEWVSEISDSIISDEWNGEDVMGIFFNEFNRYKKKSESGQIFTPDHITSFMYRLIGVNKDDYILDAACGSGAFLVKSMCNMMKESGGINTQKAIDIRSNQLYGIEFDREIYALACANMLIHKDGKTNIEHLDSRSEKACQWIKSKPITKVLMNPPFETKYGCMTIVENVLNSVPKNTLCAFILPDKKLEKSSKAIIKRIIKRHQLMKIIKLPEKTFAEGVTTSIFVYKTGVPQDGKEIFTCFIEDDGLQTVKNQGRQDINNKWQEIEDYWIDIIYKQSGNKTIKWIKPALDHMSYPMPEKTFTIKETDFKKTVLDYIMFKNGIDTKSFYESLLNKTLYSSVILDDKIEVPFDKDGRENE